ncbi:hypothetical protein ARSEF1564_010311, partial [Beauveria bassiana]
MAAADNTVVADTCRTIVRSRSSGSVASSSTEAAPARITPIIATVVHLDFSKHSGTMSPLFTPSPT